MGEPVLAAVQERVVALAEGLAHNAAVPFLYQGQCAREAGLGWDLVLLGPRGPAWRPHARA